MLTLKDLKTVGSGVSDKLVGLVLEATGTLSGNERLRQAGRDRDKAGSERLMSLEEEIKAGSRAAEAKMNEARQKANQPPEARSQGRSYREQDSAGSAAAEKVKGSVKKGFAVLTGDERLEAEADAQRDKAHAQGQAAKHDAKAEVHRRKAEAASKASESERRSS